jgi:hypothetical protein
MSCKGGAHRIASIQGEGRAMRVDAEQRLSGAIRRNATAMLCGASSGKAKAKKGESNVLEAKAHNTHNA